MRSDTVVLPASMWAMMPMLRRKASFWLRPFLAGGTVALLMGVPCGAASEAACRGPDIGRPLSTEPVRGPEWKRRIQPEDAGLIKELRAPPRVRHGAWRPVACRDGLPSPACAGLHGPDPRGGRRVGAATGGGCGRHRAGPGAGAGLAAGCGGPRLRGGTPRRRARRAGG